MKTMLLIFVIGDSISMGWGKYVDAHRPNTNCQHTTNILAHLDEWLPPGTHWPVIVFNAGLHDCKHHTTPEQYAANLREIVRRLRPHCDRLYFCSTTPGRPQAKSAYPELVDKLNSAALDVMKSEGVPVIDLHGLCAKHPLWWNSDHDIHYSEEGYKGMAEYVKHALTPSGN